MRRRTQTQLVLSALPSHLDLLDADLDDKYPGIPKPINWGMIVGAVDNAWSESVQIPGVDWVLSLCMPGDLKLPSNMTPTGRVAWRPVARHCALAVTLVKESTPNRARDMGRPAVRALLAMLRRHYPYLVLSDTIWEGLFITRRGKIGFATAESRIEVREAKQPSQLSEIGLDLLPVKILAVPPHVTRALQWMELARASSVRVDTFAHLWLALIALVAFGQPPRQDDMVRIRAYLNTLRTGAEDHPVFSRSRVDGLEALFLRAYDARNALFHRDDDTAITADFIEDLESGIFELIEPEVARVRAR